MPDRSRRARRDPPSTWDHILSHPVESAAAIWWAVLGCATLVGLHPEIPSISRGIDALPWPIAMSLGLAVGLGGVLTMIGVCWPGERLDIAWNTERTGLFLAMGSWAGYLVILFNSNQIAVFTVSMTLSFICGIILRLLAIESIEDDTRREIDEAGMTP